MNDLRYARHMAALQKQIDDSKARPAHLPTVASMREFETASDAPKVGRPMADYWGSLDQLWDGPRFELGPRVLNDWGIHPEAFARERLGHFKPDERVYIGGKRVVFKPFKSI
jgi:hypothetical protein